MSLYRYFSQLILMQQHPVPHVTQRASGRPKLPTAYVT